MQQKTPPGTNYWDYIRVEDLLTLQGGMGRDESQLGNDEVMFIVVHQVYELWFKLVLRELTTARDLFMKEPVPDNELAAAVRSFRRVVTIFQQAVNHFQVMETMTTRDYLEFRDQLIPASGFQSAQLREIEILLGLEDERRVPLGREGSYKEALRSPDGSASVALARVETRLASGPPLREVLYRWLSRTPVDGPSDPQVVRRFLEKFVASMRGEIERRVQIALDKALTPADVERLRERYEAEVRHAEAFLLAEDDPGADEATREKRRAIRAGLVFIESYRELPRLAWPREILDAVIDMEQAMLIWRQRHARMVERVIGRRTGTGGSAGVDYLDQTALRYRVFHDIWAVRTVLLRKPVVPSIARAEDYGFRIED
ncbi:tryptophan 2,3-dioxygenase family protein [Chondromyces apiculatus]|uniref:Tryptophan 2,3-dioxygenase n=1 Tax=Chondromyces apiculatus DSM 436 TaxID=1192034 RepID=A0A017T5I8_9BACT|nr:tryptophan 2,3-dioxygenase family protein [Chondromyces apiculatus]EYF04035.1 Tryptophan 2,3-dioxygenase [Chondromyces apiculatus DSM 436]